MLSCSMYHLVVNLVHNLYKVFGGMEQSSLAACSVSILYLAASLPHSTMLFMHYDTNLQ